jgi:hypothetical protein
MAQRDCCELENPVVLTLVFFSYLDFAPYITVHSLTMHSLTIVLP